MSEYLTPGVYFEFYDTAPPVIRNIRTDITGFVGLAERGPLNKAVQIDSWRQFSTRFGNFVPYSFLAYAVKGFFENGGRTCFIVRVAGVTAEKASLTLKNNTGEEVLRIFAADEGTWGNKIVITLTNVRPSEMKFSLVVTRNRLESENFPDLSLKPDDLRYFVGVINEGTERTKPSQWIWVEDVLPSETQRAAMYLPDAEQSKLKNGSASLQGGQDGIATLTTSDFLGDADPLVTERRGLSAFDRVNALGIVCIPDIHVQATKPLPQVPPIEEPPVDPCLPGTPLQPVAVPRDQSATELPPVFSKDEILAVQRAMIEHCERRKDRIAVLDTPLLNPETGRTFSLAEIRDWRSDFDSERGYGSLYYPWVKVIDPLRANGSLVRAIPPCGHIAGLYARTDIGAGVHKAPANAELLWTEDVTVGINNEEQGVLNPESVNCIRAFPGRGIRVYGARTLASNPSWRYVNVRRLLLMIEKAVDMSTQWAAFEPHDFKLRHLIVLSISSFLEAIWRRGGLDGATAKEAFYVKCDETNNPPEVVNQGMLVAEVGVRPASPAEFVIFRVGRTAEEFEIVEE